MRAVVLGVGVTVGNSVGADIGAGFSAVRKSRYSRGFDALETTTNS